ncbi:hypothetical protein BLA6993_06709 [Burkholderia lata]|uniref:hypothetical protein n=1 Tax=Burkholderia lata (strain ATCC 17760 / DSM 23089 / LMG 22485 / NCIMB 9086 / R18194 / 383) TaxID=482957 RepID=UPI0014543FF9|nr:hypothetical protein [Burkholderia lata]VWC35791.1 hypothetical protein BLA6993_06709 [Burkholderia lata]
MNEVDVKWVVFSSFVGSVREGVRAIAYDFDADLIEIYVYLAREPDEEDGEVVDAVIAEIMASCPQFNRQKMEISKSSEPIGKLRSYKGWIFARYEG